MMVDDDNPLLHLLTHWQAAAAEAHDHYRQQRGNDMYTANYYRGVAETYERAALDLQALISHTHATETEPIPSIPTAAIPFVQVAEADVNALLRGLGLFPRALKRHDDGAFTATFSKLQSHTNDDRTAALQAADPRLRILDVGNLRDTGEPFIDFGFVEVQSRGSNE